MKGTRINEFKDFKEGMYLIKYSSLTGKTKWEKNSDMYFLDPEEVCFKDIDIPDWGPNSANTRERWTVHKKSLSHIKDYYSFIYFDIEKYPEMYL